MGKKLNFDEIVRNYQQGGPVAQALPVNNHIQQNPNPYTDISDLTDDGSKQAAAAADVDMDLINKADGLIGEKKALYNRVQNIQQEIRQKATENPLWLQTREGMGMLNELRSSVVVGANSLKRSKELFEEGSKRVEKNESGTHFIQDLSTGRFIVKNRETGELEKVSRYDFLNNQDKYQGIRNEDAERQIEAAATNPSNFQHSIDLKNAMGLTKGSKLIMDEVNDALSKAGSDSLSNSEDTFALIQQLRETDGIKELVENGNFTPNSVAKLSMSKTEKSNWNHLQSIVNNLIDDPNRLSAAAKRGLENQIVDEFARQGISFDSQREMDQAIKQRMGATLLSMAIEQRSDATSTDKDISVDEKEIPLGQLTGPVNITLGNWDNVSAYALDTETYNKYNDNIPFGSKHTAFNSADLNGIIIGEDSPSDPEFSQDQAAQMLERFYASSGHAMRIPVYAEGDKAGKPALDVLQGKDPDTDTAYRVLFERAHANGLKEIQKLKEEKASKDEIIAAGERMDAALEEIVKKSGSHAKLELRTAMILRGKIEGDTSFWGNKVGNKIKDTGGIEDSALTTKKDLTGSGGSDTKFWNTSVIVPMAKNVTLDGMVNGDYRDRASRKLGGKLTLKRVGGKLLSFNDIR